MADWRWRTTLALALALAASACGGGGDARQGSAGAPEQDEPPPGSFGTFGGGPPGGTLVVLSDREPDNLNPLTYDSNPAYQLVHLMFRALGRRDSTLSNYVPDFLEKWETPDSATVILHVRPDLKWHDGRPARAEDVVFTIERQKNEEVASTRQADVEPVTSVRALDSLRVEVKLSRGGPATLHSLLEVVPVPKHLLDTIPPGRLRFARFNEAPVGSGLFRFVRWDKNQQVIVEANREAAGGRPALDRIVVRNVPDANARLTELLAGQGDLAKVTAEQRPRIETAQNVRLDHAARVRPAWIAFNVEKPPVDQADVRRAIAMGIDRKALAAALFDDSTAAALSPIPPTLREHSPNVQPLPYNPAMAQQTLERAGWRDTNGDGIREKDGKPLIVEVEYSSSDPVRADMLVAMQAELRKIGVNLVPKAYESATWVSRLRAQEFTASFWGWGWGPGVMAPNANMLWHSRSIPPGGPNFAGYDNPRVDGLIDSLLVSRDTTRTRNFWRGLEQQVINDAVYVPIFYDPEFYGVNARFRGVKLRGPEWWEDVIYWWIPEDQRLPRDRQAEKGGGQGG
ncbi:MAG TPA: ABC transporter substrate-binding protein [Longimicrobium sp.]|nr:ABC transporter substrate-binding protein [Longimicrobium sp.]